MKSARWLMLLALALAAVAVVSLGLGAHQIAPGDVVQALLNRGTDINSTIVWNLRLSRVLLAGLVGAGLGVAGAGYQGLFRNPLADPFVIGASSGAAFGATLAVIAGFEGTFFGFGPLPAAALIGSLGAVGIVYGIAAVGSQVPTVSLLLAGVAVSSFLSSLVSLMMYLNEDKLATIFNWLLGSLAAKGWGELAATAPPVLLGSAALWLLSRPLDALAFGEETAASLGLRLKHTRAAVIVAASFITAAAVAAGGVICFVGLIAPHTVRMLVGPRHALLFPGSFLMGALLLLLADDLARSLMSWTATGSPTELPVGVITALLGAPFFLYLLKTRQQQMAEG